MIFRTSKEQIDLYFEDTDYLSQSMIKKILKGVESLKDETEKDLYYEEKGHFIIGSAVDTLLTMSEEQFKENYHVSLVNKPSGKTLSVLHLVFDNMVNLFQGQEINKLSLNLVANEDILQACNIEDFQSKWKDDTRVNAIMKYEEYFNDLCKAFGKQTITFEDFNLINTIVDNFKNSRLKWVFDDSMVNSKDYDLYFQYPIYFEYQGIKCKSLLDIMVVDHKQKRIGIIDLKTTGDNVINFYKAVTKFRYDIQASFYRLAAGQFGKTIPEISDYLFGGFSFAVESTIRPNGVSIFECDKELLDIGKSGRPGGFVVTTGGVAIYYNEIEGFIQGIDLYKWHLQNGFEKNKKLVENDGVLKLGWNRYI